MPKLINPSGREVDVLESDYKYLKNRGFTDAIPEPTTVPLAIPVTLPENFESLSAEEIKELAKTVGVTYTTKKETIERLKELDAQTKDKIQAD